jgi:Domain of unknown function DUF11
MLVREPELCIILPYAKLTGVGKMKGCRFILRYAPMLAVLWLLASAGTARGQDLPVTDLAVTQAVDVSHAKSGTLVTFTVVGQNLGPDDVIADSFDIFPSDFQALDLVDVQCDRGVSSDGPFCEYGPLAAGESVTTVYVARVLATGSKTASLTVCATRETSDYVDPDAGNDCATTTLKITGKRSIPD